MTIGRPFSKDRSADPGGGPKLVRQNSHLTIRFAKAAVSRPSST